VEKKKTENELSCTTITVAFMVGVALCATATEEQLVPLREKSTLPSRLTSKMKDISWDMATEIMSPLLGSLVEELGGWDRCLANCSFKRVNNTKCAYYTNVAVDLMLYTGSLISTIIFINNLSKLFSKS
jgi:hypothetical protein